jgi:hypothetical protein
MQKLGFNLIECNYERIWTSVVLWSTIKISPKEINSKIAFKHITNHQDFPKEGHHVHQHPYEE